MDFPYKREEVRGKTKQRRLRFAPDVATEIPDGLIVKTMLNPPSQNSSFRNLDASRNSKAATSSTSTKLGKDVCKHCLECLSNTAIQFGNEMWIESNWSYISARALRESVQNGCGFCKIHLRHHEERMSKQVPSPGVRNKKGIWTPNEAVDNEEDEEKIRKYFNVVATSKSNVDDWYQIRVGDELFDVFADAGLTHLIKCGRSHANNNPDDPAAQWISNRPNRTDKTSDKTFSQIQSWMRECESDDHGFDFAGDKTPHVNMNRCRRNHQPMVPLPSRIVDVAATTNEQAEPKARLVEPGNTLDQYVALSYCWGEERWNTLTTTKANYEEHCKNIPIHSAAQTIKDAVSTTRRLGFRYLWVDALCIIQDSNQDKETQTSQLRSVFENASLTIIAAYGENASVGFLGMPEEHREAEFSWGWQRGGPDQPNETIRVCRNIKQRMANQPISKRAWTLEERMLSRKKLFFFADRIAWECNTIESGDVVNDGISTAHVSNNLPIHHATDTTCKVYRTKDSEHRSWTFTVQWYMMRKLTKPHDKLRAIGGLADYRQKALEDQYLAGLWRMFIPAGLLWRRVVSLQEGDGDSGLQDRPIGYRAPSWSWAAIEGDIKYTDLAEEGGSVECAVLEHTRSIESIMKLDVVDAAVNLASPNKPFGGVTGGFIRAMGMMKTIQGNFKPTSHTDFGDMFRLDLSTSPERSFVDFWPDSITDLPQYGQELCLLGVDGEGEAEKTGGSMRSKYSFYVRGVALESLPDGNFQRMGFFEYRDSKFNRLISGFHRREVKIV